MYKRILVPTDGSAVSENVVPAAVELARACGADIVALSVAVPEPAFQSVEGAMVVDPGRQGEVLLQHAQALAGSIAQRAAAAGVACTPVATLSYYPAEAILDSARAHGCDLIFMGSHGRRGLSLLLTGSVTQAVLASATVPVMVLRPTPGGAAPAASAT